MYETWNALVIEIGGECLHGLTLVIAKEEIWKRRVALDIRFYS